MNRPMDIHCEWNGGLPAMQFETKGSAHITQPRIFNSSDSCRRPSTSNTGGQSRQNASQRRGQSIGPAVARSRTRSPTGERD